MTDGDLLARLPTPEAMLADMGEPLDPGRYDWDAATAQPLSDEETFQLVYAAQNGGPRARSRA